MTDQSNARKCSDGASCPASCPGPRLKQLMHLKIKIQHSVTPKQISLFSIGKSGSY
jgi:hypothetical protein